MNADFSDYQAFDKSGMLKLLVTFPQQCLAAFNLAANISFTHKYRQFKNIVFSGMGGSSQGLDLIRSYCLYQIDYPVFLIRNYRLPKFVNQESLFFSCSYSGNTEETIAAFKEAWERKAKIIVISSGGRLLDLAKERKIPYLVIPKGYPPRQALGYAFFIPLKVLEKLGLIPNQSKAVAETFSVLENLKNYSLAININLKNNLAKKLAFLLKDRFPVIYGSGDYLDSVVIRWRGQLAENSKTLSSVNFFPEMNHNEIVGWRFPHRLLKDFIVLILRDKSEYKMVKKRIELTRQLLEKGRFKIKEIWSCGNSLMARIFSLIYIGDFTSFYLAILNKVDPTVVEPITYLKKRLKYS